MAEQNQSMADIQLTAPMNQRVKVVRSTTPIGTLAELEEAGFDPAEWGACTDRVNSDGTIGCPSAHLCGLREKYVSGPVRVGMRHVKSVAKGGGVRVVDVDCWTAVAKKAQADLDGDVISVIAVEATEANKAKGLPTTIRVSQSVEVRLANGTVRYKDEMQVREVVPFPRISDNPALLREAMANRERKEAFEQKQVDYENETVMAAGQGSPVVPIALTNGAPVTTMPGEEKPDAGDGRKPKRS